MVIDRGTETEINSEGQQGEMKRYQGRVTQYKQNRLFVNNSHQLYKELDGDVQDERGTSETKQHNTIRKQHRKMV